jgi:phosphate transport system permease protein
VEQPLALKTPEGQEPIPPPSSAPEAVPSAPPGRRVTLKAAPPFVLALVPAAIVAAIVASLLHAAGLTISFAPFRVTGVTNFGWEFFGSNWNPPFAWGIAIFVVGSFVTAIPALLLSMLIGLGIAIASVAYLPRFLTRFLDPVVDLLAGIPSVIYGIWGYVLVAPYFGTTLNPWLYVHLHFVPGLGGTFPNPSGLGIPVAVFILTLMALPITTLLIRDSLRSVPRDLWESGLALGATRWETMRRVSIPYGRGGILSAGFLGFGRAFGETVAVAMVINLVAHYPLNFYSGTATVAAEMFSILDSAYGNSQFLAALSEMALVLLAISLAVNVVGRLFIARLAATEIAGL